MYSDHYGLSGRPFQLTPDPRFYFDSATHRKAMAYLSYGLAQGEGFIVVTGEIGSGKTTLTGHLVATVDRTLVNAVRIVSTQVGGDDMLRLAAQSLGLPVDGVSKAQLLDHIEAYLIDRARVGQRTLIIVDEAQNLSHEALEELRMLSNFTAGEHAMVQIFLLGQPEFRDRLDHAPELEQLRQRVIATHHLTAMEPGEIGPYVLHRLKLVDWKGTPSFTEDAFAALYRYSGGVPRKLNNIMTRVLLMGSMENANQIDGRLVSAVIADLGQDQSVESFAEPILQPETAMEAPAPQPFHAAEPIPFPPVQAVPVASATVPDPQLLDLAARVTMLEAQVEEQGVALRRVLGLLLDWAEGGSKPGNADYYRAPAA